MKAGGGQEPLRQDYINIRDFGATGVGDETLYDVTPYETDWPGTAIFMNKQTIDGKAINAAIRYARERGGGNIYVPAGDYRVYGYLERFNFPGSFVGAGVGKSILRNCASSPTDRNGHGILLVMPDKLAAVELRDITFDGRVDQRAKPSGNTGGGTPEWRMYPLAVSGMLRLTMNRVQALNGPIDTFTTAYENNPLCWAKITNCHFSNAYRNVATLASGYNQKWTDCILEKAGVTAHGGTNPRYVLDIEPNGSQWSIKHLTFTRVKFRHAYSSVIGAVWAGNVVFNDCDIEAFGNDEPQYDGFPRPFGMQNGEYTLNNCRIKYLGPNYNSHISMPQFYTDPINAGEYVNTGFVKLNGCTFEGVGLDGNGPRMIIHNTTFKNSIYPVLFGIEGGTQKHNLEIDGLRLINMFDPTYVNRGGGGFAGFGFTNKFNGIANIKNVDIRVDPGTMPQKIIAAMKQSYSAFGWYNNATGQVIANSVNVAGYRELPDLLGVPRNEGLFRNYHTPIPANGTENLPAPPLLDPLPKSAPGRAKIGVR